VPTKNCLLTSSAKNASNPTALEMSSLFFLPPKTADLIFTNKGVASPLTLHSKS